MSARAGKPVHVRARWLSETTVGSRARQTVGVIAFLGPAQGCFRKRVASVIEPIPSTQRRTIAAAMARVVA
jgi:hypothetical protein